MSNRGSSSWAFAHAITSLRVHSVRSIGIALLLAIGIALPTTIFVWSETGIGITVHEYFDNNVYQLRIGHSFIADETWDPADISFMNGYRDDQLEALSAASELSLIERVDYIPSTLGILSNIDEGPDISEVNYYNFWGINYYFGIKDFRTIVVNNDILDLWQNEFDYRGNFTITGQQVLVSENFVNFVQEIYHIELAVGSVISFDIFRHPNYRHYGTGFPAGWSKQSEDNFTIAGIYQLKNYRSLIGEVFPSLLRRNWDVLGDKDPVLGIDDSLMILDDEFQQEWIKEMEDYGFFFPASLVRGEPESLLAIGNRKIEETMLGLIEQLEEVYPEVPMVGVQKLDLLQSHINTYIASQSLTVLMFPTLIMSVLLTVYIAEISIQRRRGEISAIRSKGASYNQVFSSFMFEAIILALLGFISGLVISMFLGPLIGSSTGLFSFNPETYSSYFQNTRVPIFGLAIGAIIALYLPGAYLLHVARGIDVTEIGQPGSFESSEELHEIKIKKYVIALIVIMLFLIIMPTIFNPTGVVAIVEIAIVTALLFVSASLGSNTMRSVTSRLADVSHLVLGERYLYIKQSFRKRRGLFMPLFLILTLTLTSSSMIIIQSASFQTTLEDELKFSLGADLRIECDPMPLSFNTTLLRYHGVLSATPIIKTLAHVSTNPFFLEGIDALEYQRIGKFVPGCFVSGTPESVLTALNGTWNGIVISEYYATLWNKTVNEEIAAYYDYVNGTKFGSFKIVGIMRNAPGFGAAATHDAPGGLFASHFGFQVVQGGFAFVNLRFLREFASIETANLFLVETASFTDHAQTKLELENEFDVHVYSSQTFDFTDATEIQLFLQAYQGTNNVILIMCIAMGLTAIAFFVGSAVLERESEYAVFRALGATRRQLVSMVFSEFAGIVFATALISLILGTVFGYSLSLLTVGLSPFSTVLPETLTYPFQLIGLIVGIESVVMITCCYVPARSAGNTNPARVLRNL